VPVSSPSHGAYTPAQPSYPMVIPAADGMAETERMTFGRVRPSTIIAVLLMVIAALVVLAAVLVVRGRDSSPIKVAAVAVKVTSNPSGATVYVDGKERGMTPFDTAMIVGEEHAISVSLAGHADVPAKHIRPMTEDGAVVVHFDLPAVKLERGTLTIDPQMADAIVYVNDQEKGKGKLTIPDLPLNSELVVRVEAHGYKTFEQKVSLSAEMREAEMMVKLEKGKSAPPPRPPPTAAAKERRVQLTTEFQTWATVYHKNRWLGTTPLDAVLPVGEVQLRVVNETMRIDKIITITVPESGPSAITLPLR
jgi:hypothetical protein